MDIFQGPVDLILSDLDLRSTSLEVRRSKSFFANNCLQKFRLKSRDKN